MFLNENTLIGGRYRIIKQLGEGSFGETYEAIDTGRFNETVIVKRLKTEPYSGDYRAKAKELFEREAETYRQLGSNHSQIPRLEAYFEENNDFYLVMEYIDELNFSENELKEGKIFEEQQLINLLKDILIVLQFIHSKNLVHRDIKPDNLIRRNSDKQIVLIDFGGVTNNLDIKHKEQTTAKKTTLGSTYAAPEQFRGEAYPCSDIYAVGMISIQALTGRLPEDLPKDPTTGERIWEHLTSASEILKRVIRKMVCFNTSQRYQSVDEVLTDIDKIDNQSSEGNNSRSIPLLPIKVIIGRIAFLIIISIAIFKRYMPPQYFYKVRYITTDEMKELCQDENYYKQKIFAQRPDLKSIVDLQFKVEGLQYNPNNEWKEIIPAYRWKCVYQPIFKDNSPEGVSNTITIGLDMDKAICQKKYSKEGLNKATFLYYEDKNSNYCVLTKQ